MSDKPFASLSPTLLARKGAARPAMRPQWQPLSTYSNEVPLPPAEPLEDLGWNDMGEAPEPVEDSPVVVPFGHADECIDLPPNSDVPEVVRQQDALAEQVAEPPAFESSPLIPLAAHRYARGVDPQEKVERRSALGDGRRAAFTLRVDESRHLKLRLACTMPGRSAQQIVTEALDRLLDELPELDDLAKRVKRR
jgi:hypothetical protein